MSALPAGTASWVQCRDGGVGTLNAVFGGMDNGNRPLFVARFKVEQELVPGKINPVHQYAFVSYAGGEQRNTTYEVLQCTGKVSWVPASKGFVPPGALVTGHAGDHSPLYSCRAHHNNTITIGKVHPSNGTAFISYAGRAVKVSDYEVLVVTAANDVQRVPPGDDID